MSGSSCYFVDLQVMEDMNDDNCSCTKLFCVSISSNPFVVSLGIWNGEIVIAEDEECNGSDEDIALFLFNPSSKERKKLSIKELSFH
ncbi:hypothetical protein O6P43_019881 [Quillaja saponaria]|uniref:Uncharacterized protein n=1 Tax=Quillaja saponaria TaxID=32244 RepID=A0AAD7PLP4_QUISA|nr:hypothetical protein O6P43_019881 [Quillaja saponaria]